MGTPAGSKNVLVFHTLPYYCPQKRPRWSHSPVFDPFLSNENIQVQPLGQPGMGHPSTLGSSIFFQGKEIWTLCENWSGNLTVVI